MGAKVLECVGYSEIVVKQVRNQIHYLSPCLINYQKLIRDLTNSFPAFNIKSVPRSHNFHANILANIASRLIPPGGFFPQIYSIELMYSPSILDNVMNWKVFDDDEQILDFLSAQDTFQGMSIDEADHDKSLSDISNITPKSIINLEIFYDLQDKFK